jgi:uroporphyrinogen III methyltransferase/synthase
LKCELAHVAETLARHPEFQPPVISIVGEVVRAAQETSWFMSRPLFGHTFVVTSPPDPSRALEQLLREAGGDCISVPAMEIVPPDSWHSLDDSITLLPETDWLVFSSGHGVRSFFERLQTQGLDARRLATTQLAAVGPSTANAIRSYGLRCDLVPEREFGAESLWKLLEPIAPGKRFTLVHAPEGNALLQHRLMPIASRVTLCEAYRQLPVESWPIPLLEHLRTAPNIRVIVTSSNAARHSVRLLQGIASDMKWLSISASVTEVLQGLGCSDVTTSDGSNYEGVVRKAFELAAV